MESPLAVHSPKGDDDEKNSAAVAEEAISLVTNLTEMQIQENSVESSSDLVSSSEVPCEMNKTFENQDSPNIPSCSSESRSGENQFWSKYYDIDQNTKQEMWLRKSTPPAKVEVYPVGDPRNKGLQTVWRATHRECNYFDVQRFILKPVPPQNVIPTKDKNFQDLIHPNVVYSGKFVQACPPKKDCFELLHPFLPDKKMAYLENLVSKYGPTVWTRVTETFGHSLAKIVMTVQIRTKGKLRVLIMAGSNFQGSSCVAAARYLASFGVEVYICFVQTSGLEETFPGSTSQDLHYDDVRIIVDLKGAKNQKFHVVIFGVDDHKSPTTTLHVYREMMMGSEVVLVEPPMISQSYSSLINGICYQRAGASIIVNAIRPSPCTLDEDSLIFVVNIPTSNEYPIFRNGDYHLIKSMDRMKIHPRKPSILNDRKSR